MFEYGQFKAQREITPSLSDYGFFAGCHTRWHGLESHLLDDCLFDKAKLV